MKNAITELSSLLNIDKKKDRRIMTVTAVLSSGMIKCTLNEKTEILKGSFSLNDSVIVVGSEIVGLAHKIINEYEI